MKHKRSMTLLWSLLSLALLVQAGSPVQAQDFSSLSSSTNSSIAEEKSEKEEKPAEVSTQDSSKKEEKSQDSTTANSEKASSVSDSEARESKEEEESQPEENKQASKPAFAILHTNDVHCGAKGYADLAAARADLQEAGIPVLTLDAGDAIQGDALGSESKGSWIIDIMNTVGYDYMVPGNHEFDYQIPRYFEILGKAKFETICCNFMDLVKKSPVFKPYVVKEINGVKVGIVGICTPETYTKSTPKYFQDDKGNYLYSFSEKNLYQTVQKAIDGVRKEGAQFVVALGHIGNEGITKGWKSSDLIKNTSGLSIFIDGHAHETLSGLPVPDKTGKTVNIVSTGTKLKKYGEILVNKDGSYTNSLKDAKVTPKSEKAKAAYAAVKAKLDKYNAIIEKKLSQKIATVDFDLTVQTPDGSKRAIRSAETNMGDLVADAYRKVLHADISLVNGGGIRASIPKGDVTRKSTGAVNPWSNEMCVIEADGQTILDALEHGARLQPEENGGFLQVSGLSYVIDLNVKESPVVTDDKGAFQSIKEGAPRRIKNVMVGNKPLDPKKIYTIASTKYVLQMAGDGYTNLAKMKMVDQPAWPDVEVLNKYIVENLEGKIPADQYGKPEGTGRILIVKEGEKVPEMLVKSSDNESSTGEGSGKGSSGDKDDSNNGGDSNRQDHGNGGSSSGQSQSVRTGDPILASLGLLVVAAALYLESRKKEQNQ